MLYLTSVCIDTIMFLWLVVGGVVFWTHGFLALLAIVSENCSSRNFLGFRNKTISLIILRFFITDPGSKIGWLARPFTSVEDLKTLNMYFDTLLLRVEIAYHCGSSVHETQWFFRCIINFNYKARFRVKRRKMLLMNSCR